MILLKDLNLMPRDIVIKKNYKKLLRIVIIGVTIVLFISLIVDMSLLFYKHSYDKKVNNQLSTIDSMIGAQNDSVIQELIAEKIDYKNKACDLINKTSYNISGIFDTIEAIIPKDISIDVFDIGSEGKVSITCISDTEESIIDFYHNFKSSDLTDYVEFEEITGILGDPKGFKFSFAFQLKGIGSDVFESEFE